MPTTVSYPGVYIEEVASGVRTITGVATSITGFIGSATMGPTHEPISVKSFPDYARIFGGLDANSMMGYSVSHFFANGGTDALIVRIAPGDARATTITLTGPSGDLELEARGEGVWGNRLRVIVETGQKTAEPTDVKLFNLRIQFFDDRINSDPENAQLITEEYFRNVSTDGASSRFVENVLEDSSSLVRVKGDVPERAPSEAGPIQQKIWEDGFDGTFYTQGKGGAEAVPSVGLEAEAAKIVLRTKSSSRWNFVAAQLGLAGNNVRVRIEEVATNRNAFKLIAWVRAENSDGSAAEIDVEAQPSVVVETSPTLTLAELKTKIDGSDVGPLITVDEVLDEDGNPIDLATIAAPSSLPNFHLEPSNKWAIPGDGFDGTQLEPADYTRAGLAGQDNGKKKGLNAFEHADLFNLLCIPPVTRGTNTNPIVYAAALDLCHRERAFLIVDPSVDWQTAKAAKDNLSDVIGEMDSKKLKNAAIYFPHLKMADPLRGNNTAQFVPSGAMAGVFSYTDAVRGVWKAPAGIEAGVAGVRELSVKLSDPEHGDLNPLGINCVRNFPVYGNVVWGSRTLDGADVKASEWKYVPVRRFTLFLEESLYRGTQWVVFEPNDEPLWAQIRQNVGAFMQGLFRKGAFQGQTAKDAYFVKCDSTTTTQNDINQGIVNIEVGFAPLKPAEFVIIKIQQIAGDIDT